MTDPTGARVHALHADLVVAVCHVPPGSRPGDYFAGDPEGQITPRVSWDWDVTPVQRIQLTESAMAALTEAHQQAMADHAAGGPS